MLLKIRGGLALLMQQAAKELIDTGICTIQLSTSPNAPSHAFYLKHGFVDDGPGFLEFQVGMTKSIG